VGSVGVRPRRHAKGSYDGSVQRDMTAEASSIATEAAGSEDLIRTRSLIGIRLREARRRYGVGVRELSRQVPCSASLISQIEHGRSLPSVSTLYALTAALGVSMDSLFAEALDDHVLALEVGTPVEDQVRWTGRPAIQRGDRRRVLTLERGVRWEFLTPTPEASAGFMEVQYAAGAESSVDGHSTRHNGREFSLVLEGELSAQIGFEDYRLAPGDSLAFDSTLPHRFWNDGDVPTRAVFFVLGDVKT